MKSNIQFLRGTILLGIMLFAITPASFAFTKNGHVYRTDGSQNDVANAIADATAGDTVSIPAGTFTWGSNGSYVSVSKAITLTGAGTNVTFINTATTAGTYGNGTIRLSAPATVQSFSITAPTNSQGTFFSTSVNGWRITNIYGVVNGGAYFLYFGSYGLMDHCTVVGGHGSMEGLFGRGPTDSWQTVQSMGTTNNVVIEDCVFNNLGYVCDANSNARIVIRFCTINGTMKIDGHGKASNTPARGVRHMEVYRNHWTNTNSFWAAIELRGGTGMIFDNVCDGDGVRQWFYLTDYGYTAQWPNFSKTFQTPINYPVDDQIGVGMDNKVAGSEPMYLWNNTAASNTDWVLTWKQIPQGAIDLYRSQVGDSNATFFMSNVIKANVDYFKGTKGVPFTGNGGVGIGTKSQMLAITPTMIGVGFWVTDEGSWNTKQVGPAGCLYVWNGSDWIRKYTPLIYPHPLRAQVRR